MKTKKFEINVTTLRKLGEETKKVQGGIRPTVVEDTSGPSITRQSCATCRVPC